MRLTGLLIVTLVALLIVGNYWAAKHLPPNTYLNERNLGLQSKEEVLEWLANSDRPKFRVKVEDRVYTFSYRDLGVLFDLNQTYSLLAKDSNLPFPRNLQAFLSGFRSQRTILPQLVFSQDYYQRVEQLRFDLTTIEDRVLLDSGGRKLVYENHQDLFKVDPRSLQKEIIVNYGQKEILQPVIHRVFDNQKSLKIADYNARLTQTFSQPVKLYVDDTATNLGLLKEEDLERILKVDYDEAKEWLTVGIEEEAFDQLASTLVFDLSKSNDLKIDRTELKEKLISLINSRFNGYSVDSLVVHFSEAPNTKGTEAGKYIEIDISQQRMYLWEGNQTVATYRISSGLYYPTPPGRYKVLNKATNAYSDIYQVWMPYWMAFSLDPKVNAYLGIHELPYWVDPTGQEIRRPRDFIGSPHTGGCVSLDVGEAAEVYAWTEIGDPVIIYD